MLEITINRDGSTSIGSETIIIGNKFENLDESIKFSFPEDLIDYHAYLIGVHGETEEHVIIPINEGVFKVTSAITHLDGQWYLYVNLRSKELDLNLEEIDLDPRQDEHVFMSDQIKAKVKSSKINRDSVEKAPLDANLKIVYEELMDKVEENTVTSEQVDAVLEEVFNNVA